MSASARVAIVTIVLLFLWRDKVGTLVHPTDVPPVPAAVAPGVVEKAWVADLKPAGILPGDRLYYSAFYDALGAVLAADGERDVQVIDTTEKFRRFHSGSLDLAIEKAKVGKYPGLGEAIDKAFAMATSNVDPQGLRTPADVEKAAADGLTPRPMTRALRDRLRTACVALSWKFAINGE